MNACADAWCWAQAEAQSLDPGLEAGQYVHEWDGGSEEPCELVQDELRRILRRRGLTLDSDSVGIRAVALSDEEMVIRVGS